MVIDDIKAREIFDSRGEKTLEIELISDSKKFRAQIPSGKSTGEKEAVVLPYDAVVEVLEGGLKDKLLKNDLNSIRELDSVLLGFDDSPNKKRIGGNLSLGISVAFARALASVSGKEVWEVVRGEFFSDVLEDITPSIFSNMINGGEHAKTNLDIQEYIVIGNNRDPIPVTVSRIVSFYKELGKYLINETKSERLPIGDEGGYAIDFSDNFEPIKLLGELIAKLNLEKYLSLGIDSAATQFMKSDNYIFEGRETTTDELADIYLKYFQEEKLFKSIEDPFGEKDLRGFKELKKRMENDKIVVGDDITTTHTSLIEQYADEGLISGVIIKPNQVGTITETCNALRMAKDKKLYRIISHRSGEVEDTFIIHLAKASGAEGVKIGSPTRERIYKFNELIRIY